MREIKFRAWDKWMNIFHHSWGEGSGLSAALWLKMFPNVSEEEAQKNGFGIPEKQEWHERIIFNQYIGRQDEYGIEIYDGDIVEIAEQPLLRFEIVYSTEHAAFMRRWLSSLVSVTRECGTEEHIPPNTTFWKVIGNRYENPELLQ